MRLNWRKRDQPSAKQRCDFGREAFIQTIQSKATSHVATRTIAVSEPIDLSNCDREPIHIPGSIQPHGCLLVADRQLRTFLRQSQNAPGFFNREIDNIVGMKVEDLFGSRVAHDLRNAFGQAINPARPATLSAYPLSTDLFCDISVHAFKGQSILEFEKVEIGLLDSPLEPARELISRMREARTIDALFRQAPRLLKAVLGYDRVMLYRFEHDGSGKVISEAKRSDLESFLGQHFPASDIPKQARELYLRNTVRIISDVFAEQIPIHPVLNASGEPLDMSYAHLRSVSPIHREYLRNMGVAASMSISIVIGGKLWGLLACHHYTPRVLRLAHRIAAEVFGDFFSLHLQAVIQEQRLNAARHARRALDKLLSEISLNEDSSSPLRNHLHSFAQLIQCDGVGLRQAGTYHAFGTTPPSTCIDELAGFLNEVTNGQIWATHELSGSLPAAEKYRIAVSGVLAVPLSQIPGDYLMFYRKEVSQTIEWAGDPKKEYAVGQFGDRLTPRKSFSMWKQTVEFQSLPWSESDREIAEAIRTTLLEVILRQAELLSEEKKKAEVRQKVLNEELNHRVKNVLALIKSIVSQPVDSSQSIETYAASLKERIMALALAHDQIVRHDGGGSIKQLLTAELSPYSHTASIDLSGPSIDLDGRAYSVLALIFHELATNAAKYGALSMSGTSLEVNWSLQTDGSCKIGWIERGGPPVRAPLRRGFGSILIDRSIPFDLGGKSDIQFDPAGVKALLVIPARFIRKGEETAVFSRVPAPTSQSNNALEGLRILLVEDQLLIALEAEDILLRHGAHSVSPTASSADALLLLDALDFDCAVLDVNLGDGTSLPVAEELTRRRIPYVFATGYGEAELISPNSVAAPFIRKPYEAAGLIGLLKSLFIPPKISG
ncbi:MAG: GAF domain-containing protein [Hyphomicrobium sp.]|nr:MAG: GAF domain-containing protein [Hyphomicrobium sp.]